MLLKFIGPDEEPITVEVDYDQTFKSIKDTLINIIRSKLNKEVSDILILGDKFKKDINSNTPRNLHLDENQTLLYIPLTSAKKSFPTFEKNNLEQIMESFMKSSDSKNLYDVIQHYPSQKFKKLLEEDNEINSLLKDEDEANNIMAQLASLENKYFFSIMVDNGLNNIEHDPVGLHLVSRYMNKISDALEMTPPMEIVESEKKEKSVIGYSSMSDGNDDHLPFCHRIVKLIKSYVYLCRAINLFDAYNISINKLNNRLSQIKNDIESSSSTRERSHLADYYILHYKKDVDKNTGINDLNDSLLREVAFFLYKNEIDVVETMSLFNEYLEQPS